jgi:hypothetical protein
MLRSSDVPLNSASSEFRESQSKQVLLNAVREELEQAARFRHL